MESSIYSLHYQPVMTMLCFVAALPVSFKFAYADTDGDGALTRGEWVLKFGNADSFDAHDLDGDGAVSVFEYQMGELDVMEQRGSNLVQV